MCNKEVYAMGLLSEINQLSKAGSRDQLNALLHTGSDSACAPSLHTKRITISQARHNAELSLAALFSSVKSI